MNNIQLIISGCLMALGIILSFFYEWGMVFGVIGIFVFFAFMVYNDNKKVSTEKQKLLKKIERLEKECLNGKSKKGEEDECR